MKKSEELNELGTALAQANIELSNPKATSDNPFFKSKYADLAEIINVSRPVLSKHGLSVIQTPSYDMGIVTVETMMLHSSGQWIIGEISAPADKPTAQGIGSAITYCRRYSLAAICCLAHEEDDDGQEATKSSSKKPTQPPKVAKAAINKACKELDRYYAITVSESAAEVAKQDARAKALVLCKRAEKSEVTQVYDKYHTLFKKHTLKTDHLTSDHPSGLLS